MDEVSTNEQTDLALGYLEKQDLSDLSVDDLKVRIGALTDEIARCEAQILARGSSRLAAEEVFKI